MAITQPPISATDVAFYRTQGYLVVPDVMDADLLSRARAALAEMLEGARGLEAHTAVYDLEPSHRPDAPRVRRIKTPHLHHPLFREIAHAPRLLAVLHALLGPAVRLHGSKINMKAPHYGSPVEWHQDWAFYPHTNDDVLAVGVMLDDATEQNGPLMIVPDTHRGPVFDHHANGAFCGAMDPEACGLDFAGVVRLTGRAGSMSFHHARAVHGSAQNRSDLPRSLLLYEFTAADAWPLMGVKDLAEFDSRIVSGSPTIAPRLADVPVRMPLPPARHQGSIYENQNAAARRYFELAK
ncbi:MAG TPA: phytanoyl-CoA dioxygenase family protein [Acetobacteraceae bacterium]|nr:phytanoyl-CoA dioxygenase family protein [Acetobacteraceae bacterium]